MPIDVDTLVRDAETTDREVFEARADAARAWLDNGGIDELAAFYAPAATDDTDPLPF